MAAGAGDVVADFEYPEPQPPPFTTIAWRMGHISIGVLGMRAANHFGEPGTVEYPTDRLAAHRRRRSGNCSTTTTTHGRPASGRSATMACAGRADRRRDRSPSTRWRRWCCTSRAR